MVTVIPKGTPTRQTPWASPISFLGIHLATMEEMAGSATPSPMPIRMRMGIMVLSEVPKGVRKTNMDHHKAPKTISLPPPKWSASQPPAIMVQA